MRGKLLRLQPGQRAAPLHDQIDRLRRQRPLLHRLPTVDGTEDRPLADVGPFEPFAQSFDRRSHQKHPARLVRHASLGPAELDRQARQCRRLRILGIEQDRRFVAELLDPQPRHLAAPASAGGEREQQDGKIAGIGQPVGPAGSEQTVEDVAGDRPLALALPRPGARPDRQPECRAQTGRAERTLLPFPAMQGAPACEAPLDRRRRMRAGAAQHLAFA